MEEISVEKSDFEDILKGSTGLPISAELWQENFRTMIREGGCIWLSDPDGVVRNKAILSAEGQLGWTSVD